MSEIQFLFPFVDMLDNVRHVPLQLLAIGEQPQPALGPMCSHDVLFDDPS
jgi:hypothetical protein